MLNLHEIRQEYRLKSLDRGDLKHNPFEQFEQWFLEAKQAKIPEFNAMALSTASLQGRPSCRMVLLKSVDAQGFVFFTNTESRKGQELAANPWACATFYWQEIERQVIIDGAVRPVSQQQAEDYFSSRPRGAQLSAWASHQDQTLSSRMQLEEAYRHYEAEYADRPIPMPSYWGGYCLRPERFEFWQGRPNRLHDRFRYLLHNHFWIIERLAP